MEVFSKVFTIALALFLMTNPIGNTPTILSLVQYFSPSKQRKILMRETLLSMVLALFFLAVGDSFLKVLQIERYAMSICAGTILVLVALSMIFPKPVQETAASVTREPFFVPIATPILVGGGCLTSIMLFAAEEGKMIIFFAILLSTIGVGIVMFIAPTLQQLLGRRGMIALEQLMGMLLLMMSLELIVNGFHMFVTDNLSKVVP